MGRNELGRTKDAIAAFTGDWSDNRCGLNPAPIESIAMMICSAFGGGGGLSCVVSVLCGAGGGLTVHAAISIDVANNALATRRRRRKVIGTPFRLTAVFSFFTISPVFYFSLISSSILH